MTKSSNKYPMEMPDGTVSFDPSAFNRFENDQGIRLIHYKALRCPVGMTDIDDNRRPHEDHSGCSNGFLYYKAGCITAGMQGNGNNSKGGEMGYFEQSYITASFPQTYDGSDEKFNVAMFDRFYLDEQDYDANIIVPTWHLQIAHESGLDKLNYPAVCVEKLVDSRNVEYKEGVDFVIENGQIRWTTQNRPGSQTDVGRGVVYTIRYCYRPYWYVAQLLHEIRVAQEETMSGRILVRMPQQVLLAREHTFTNESVDKEAVDSNSARQTQTPKNGGFGPR